MLGGRTLGGGAQNKKKRATQSGYQSGYQGGGGGSQIGSGLSVQGAAGMQQKGGAPTGGAQMPGQRPGGAHWMPIPGIPSNVNQGTQKPAGDGGGGAPIPTVTATPNVVANAGVGPTSNYPTRDLVEQWIRDKFSGGVRDTSDEQALIERLMQGATGQGLVDSRARAGRFGMAASGAQAGIEGDVRRQMADAALERIFGVQQGARDEAFRNQQAAANTWLGFQRNELDAEQQRLIMEALLGLDPGSTGGGSGAGALHDAADDVLDEAESALGIPPQTISQETMKPNAGGEGDSQQNPVFVETTGQIPEPRTGYGRGIYQGGDGRWYQVTESDYSTRTGDGVGSAPATGLFDVAPWLNPKTWGVASKVS